MAEALEAPAPLVVVGQLPVVHHRDVRERIGPVGMGVRDVDIGLGGHPHVPDPVRTHIAVELVGRPDRVGVAQVLDDLERRAGRQDLGAGNRLDVVGQVLEIAVVVERGDDRVVVDLVDRVDARAGRADARLDLLAPATEPVRVFDVPVRIRVGQLDPHDQVGRRPAVQRVPGRVGAAVLHGLEHPGHVGAQAVGAVAVPIDDPRDPAHGYGSTSRYSSRSQSVTAAR